MLDNAIPEHLRGDRTLPANTPSADFQPAYPSYSARFPEKATELVMALIGAQYKTKTVADALGQSKISSFLVSDEAAPSFHEWTSFIDNKGYYNLVAFAYWPSTADYETWSKESGFKKWWESLQVGDHSNGWFLEVFNPPMQRFETLFNTQTPEGSGHLREAWSGEIQKHGYWGSMRDRLPISLTDSLEGTKVSIDPSPGAQDRVRVPGKQNLAIIRSGQDWLITTPEERELYLNTMQPVLIKGMDFLRDHGEEVDCYSCRFMDVIDPATRAADKDRTFGVAYFSDLKSLESWCKKHPTHLAIFGGFFQYAKKLKYNVNLRVFHEVMVLEPDQQFFEYIGCHPGTGMLQ
ncbi:unnamed protein product [Clonostachys chloroleuca]|uniref:Phenylacetaldoxime dehydratase n=1 Tax=Clonostachys chloroleuca TaxID=1926264 RepID=A0AA35LPR8_9HYPO|nr:unnamed protein product [Clonostachys chloroleuca]